MKTLQFLQGRVKRSERQVKLARRLQDRILEFAADVNLRPLLERAEAEDADFTVYWKHPWRGSRADIFADPTSFSLIITLHAEAKKWVLPLLPDLEFVKAYHVTTGCFEPTLNEDWDWNGGGNYRDRDDLTIRFQRPTFEGEEIGDCKVTLTRDKTYSTKEIWAVSCETGVSDE